MKERTTSVESVLSFLSFSGRATRNEYRRYALIPFLVVPGVGAIIFVPVAILVFNWWTPLAVASLFGVTVLIQMAASPLWLGITVRRLHDTGRSARWLLPYSVISVGWVLIVVGFLATDQLILRFLVDLWGVIWAFVSWAFIIKLLMLCSSLGTIGFNRYGPQSGVLEKSGGGDTELTPPKSTRIKPVLRVLGFSAFGLFAVVAVMALLAVVIVIGLATGQFIFIEGPGVANEEDCGKTVRTNRGLVDDCGVLLWVEDRLEGTGSLNWETGTAISRWDGVTIGGTPSRVTKVELNDKGLTGWIPVSLGALSELTHLDLSDNSLTGQLPRDIGLLANLEVLKLSGNSLTGCIPVVLRDVATNDLSSLNLPDCPPPAPRALTAGPAGETSVPLSWAAPANISKFRVGYREKTYYGFRPATLSDAAITGPSHTVEGLQCEMEYRFMVFAYGSGTLYAEAWSEQSEELTASTGECVPPVFGASSYAFIVPVDAEVGAVVGGVSAVGSLTEDVVTYSLVPTRTSVAFAIDDSAGQITVAADLSSFEEKSFMLTVEASDESGGTATVSATIAVTRPAHVQ